MPYKIRQLSDLVPPKGIWPTNWSNKGRGVTINPPNNYVRIRARGMYYNWYEHRAVADMMLRLNEISKGVSGVPGELPKDWEVHHLDGNNQHNCPWNLLISPKDLHPKRNMEQPRHPYTGKYLSKDEMMDLMEKGMIPDNRVPF